MSDKLNHSFMARSTGREPFAAELRQHQRWHERTLSAREQRRLEERRARRRRRRL